MNQIVPYKAQQLLSNNEQRRYFTFICVCRQFWTNAIFNLGMNILTTFMVYTCFQMATYQPAYTCAYKVMGVCLERQVQYLTWRGALMTVVGDAWSSITLVITGFTFLLLQYRNTNTSPRDINNSMKMILKSTVAY